MLSQQLIDNLYWLNDDDEVYILGKLHNSSTGLTIDSKDETYKFVNVFTNEILSKKASSIISKVSLSYDNIYSMMNNDNLIKLNDISPQSVFTTLKMRFIENKEYTFIGNDMVFINSYNDNDLYDVENYVENFNKLNDAIELPVNVLNLANSAYGKLKSTYNNQCIIFCGESGSGKTRCVQKCIEFYSQFHFSSVKVSQASLKYKNKLNSIKSILDSFGHARTNNNNNSSRFINCFRFNYSLDDDDNLKLQNVKLEPIISSLDKSRVVRQQAGDYNYNVFYQLCHSNFKGLGNVENYYILHSKSDSSASVSSLSNLQMALESLEFTVDEIDSIFSILTGIIMLGNIKFEEGKEGNARVVNNDIMTDAASFLGFSAIALLDFVLNGNFIVNGNDVKMNSSIDFAINRLETISKEIFAKLFSYVVHKINVSIQDARGYYSSSTSNNLFTIQLLDLVGTEKCQQNSLLQLCNNYCSEVIQSLILKSIREQIELNIMEELNIPQISYEDNAEVLSIMNRLFDGIENHDQAYFYEINNDNNAITSFDKSTNVFQVKHFNGLVSYNINDFEKYKNAANDDLIDLFNQNIAGGYYSMIIGFGEVDNASSMYKKTIDGIVANLDYSDNHYVKCIKCNDLNEANQWSGDFVLKKLQNYNIVSCTNLKRYQYSTNTPHEEFWKHYWGISGASVVGINDSKDKCGIVVNALLMKNIIEVDDIKIGNTAIFMKEGILEMLDKLVSKNGLKAIVFAQATIRMIISARKAALVIQANDRMADLIEKGKVRNSSNTSVLPALKEHLRYCSDELKINSDSLELAQQLITRLEEVQVYVDKMNELIRNSSIDGQDIVVKYETLLDILHSATTAEIRVTQMQEILKIVEDLKGRAQMVVTLRLAIKHGDDDLLSACLKEIRILSQKHGDFCQKDEEIGVQCLKILQKDNAVTDKCLSIMHAVRNSQEMQSISPLKKSTSKNLDEDFNTAYNKVLVLLQPYNVEPPKSQFMVDLINIFETIVKLRASNSNQRWSTLVDNAKLLRQHLTSIESMSTSASDSAKARCDVLGKVAKAELNGISKNLEDNYVLVELNRLIQQLDEDSCSNALYREDLQITISSIKSTGGQWGYEVNTLLSRLNILSMVFSSEKDEFWDDILLFTEGLSDTKARRARRTKLQERFKEDEGSILLSRLENPNLQAPTTCVILKSFKVTLSQIRDAALRGMGQKVELQLARFREKAVNKYALSLLYFATIVGKVEGTCGEIITNKVKVDSIEAVMAELYLMTLTDTNDTILDETKSVRDLVEILSVIRSHVIRGDWQKIVDFYPVACLRVLQKDFSSSNYSDMALRCIMNVKNEIGWIILGAKNIITCNALMAAISSNMLTGTIGNVCTDNINTSALEDSLQMCEKCHEGEFNGLSSKLEALVNFSGTLMNARNAYVSYPNPTDREPYVTALYEVDISFIESKDIKDEVLLMFVDTIYCECKAIYDILLSEHLVTPYFIKDDSISFSEDEGLDLTDPANLLIAHNLKLSPIVEDPMLLISLIEKSNVLKNEKFFGILPPSFVLEMNLCQRIFDFILMIKDNKWSEAIDIVNVLAHEDFEDDAINRMNDITACAEYVSHFDPMIANLNNTVSIINDFKLVMQCIDGLYGKQKYELETVIDQLKFQKKSKPGQILYDSMVNINELRIAVQNERWDDIGNLLKTIYDSKIGTGLTIIAKQEIQIIDANYQNRKSEKYLIDALLSEVLVEDDGLIDLSKVKVNKLSDALNLAKGNSNELKSVVLLKLQAAAEITLQVRSELLLKPLTVTERLLEEFKTKIMGVQSHLNISASIYAKVNKSSRGDSSSPISKNSRTSLSGITGGILYTPEKASKLINYVPVINILLKEVELIRRHLHMSEYYEEVFNLLTAGGIYEGHSIEEVDVNDIDTTNIDTAIQFKAILQDEGTHIPKSIVNVVDTLKSISALRNAVKEKNYSLMSSLCDSIQQSTISPYPEKLRTEVKVVKQIIDNNSIITTMKEELQRGKLAGAVGQVLSGKVSFSSMVQKANECKNLNPNTNEAKTLVKTAELLAPVRKLLCDNPVDWREVQKCSEKLMTEDAISDIHESVLPELKLISAHASDTLLCKKLEEALEKGGPSGVSGAIIVETINLENLTLNHSFAEECSSLSEKALQLKQACKIMLKTRSLLLQTKDSSSADIKTIHENIFKEVEKGSDLLTNNAWNTYSLLPFKQELTFIKNHCNTIEVEILIEECIYRSSHIYLNRHNSPDEYLQTAESTMLSCDDLQSALELAQSYKFQCARLDVLMQCLHSLIQLRSSLIGGHWSQVKVLLADDKLQSYLEEVPVTKTEYQWIDIEYQNHSVLVLLQSVFIYLEGADVSERSFTDNNDLIKSIEIATKTNNLSAFVSNMLLCSKYVLLLNEGINDHDDLKVSDAFIWFASNAYVCSSSIKAYVDKVQLYLQNELLLTGLTKVLSKGRAVGVVGKLNLSTVETKELGAYLQQALTLTAKTSEVKEIVEIAEAIFLLRESQLKDDIIGLKNAIELIGDKQKIPDFVVDEIAMARSEIDNMLTFLALSEALEGFNCDSKNALEIALYHIYKDIGMIEEGSINSSSLSLPIKPLEEAIDIARSKGILTNDTRTLFRKATLILSIRKAINSDDWTSVEELSSYTDVQHDYLNEYNDIDAFELNTVKSQLILRFKVTEVIKRISSGRAECIDGMVDMQLLSVDGLGGLIHDIEKITLEMCNGQLASSDSVVLQFTYSLLESAKIINNIRNLLKEKDNKAAGIASDIALQNYYCLDIIKSELRLYSIELNEVIQRNQLAELLREFANKADALKLKIIIDEAKELISKSKCELGFIHSIEKAEAIYNSIMINTALLREALSLYDISKVKQILTKASSLKLSGPEVDEATKHLQRMTEFEALAFDMKNSNGNFLYKAIFDLAVSLGMEKHPIAMRSKLILSLDENYIPTVIIAESIESCSQEMAASETIKWKRYFLNLESSQKQYALHNYPALRDSSNYAKRMSIESKELRNSMLLHSDTCIPTSLTKQSPVIAALAVWIFGNIIIPIENNMYSNPEVLLKNLIKLCQKYPIIRDEVLLQILKQLNKNTNDDRSNRLWRTLATCLTYFPPSREFENYFESFLLTEVPAGKGRANSDACIRLMHKSVFKYGYDRAKENIDSLITVKESLNNNSILKGINGNSTIDVNPPKPISIVLRGTKLNWTQRFHLIQKALGSSGNILKTNFEENWNSDILIDKLDKEVLFYLITGEPPSHETKIALELHAHKYIYSYDSIEAQKASDERISWLLQNIHIPDHDPEQAIRDTTSIFWEFVIEQMNTIFKLENGILSFDMYRDLIIAGQTVCVMNFDNKKNTSNNAVSMMT